MRLFLLFLFYALVTSILQSTFLFGLPSEAVRFQLLFLAAVLVGIKYDWRQGLGIIILLGLFSDLFTAAPFGVSVVSYMVVFLCIRVVVANIFFQSPSGRFFWVVLFSLLCQGVEVLVIFLVQKSPVYFNAVRWWIVPQAMLNGLLGMFILPFIDRYSELSWEKVFRPKGLILK